MVVEICFSVGQGCGASSRLTMHFLQLHCYKQQTDWASKRSGIFYGTYKSKVQFAFWIVRHWFIHSLFPSENSCALVYANHVWGVMFDHLIDKSKKSETISCSYGIIISSSPLLWFQSFTDTLLLLSWVLTEQSPLIIIRKEAWLVLFSPLLAVFSLVIDSKMLWTGSCLLSQTPLCILTVCCLCLLRFCVCDVTKEHHLDNCDQSSEMNWVRRKFTSSALNN